MSGSWKVTKASILRAPERDLTYGQLDTWLSGLGAPNDAAIRVRVNAPGRGEPGTSMVSIEATWEEA